MTEEYLKIQMYALLQVSNATKRLGSSPLSMSSSCRSLCFPSVKGYHSFLPVMLRFRPSASCSIIAIPSPTSGYVGILRGNFWRMFAQQSDSNIRFDEITTTLTCLFVQVRFTTVQVPNLPIRFRSLQIKMLLDWWQLTWPGISISCCGQLKFDTMNAT